jgi:hypothetical protein
MGESKFSKIELDSEESGRGDSLGGDAGGGDAGGGPLSEGSVELFPFLRIDFVGEEGSPAALLLL